MLVIYFYHTAWLNINFIHRPLCASASVLNTLLLKTDQVGVNGVGSRKHFKQTLNGVEHLYYDSRAGAYA